MNELGPSHDPQHAADPPPLATEALPVTSIHPREFLGEFRELLRERLQGAPYAVSVPTSQHIAAAVSKLALFLAREEGLTYNKEREARAALALREEGAVAPTEEGEHSLLHLLLTRGRDGAHRLVAGMGADESVSSEAIDNITYRLRWFLRAAEEAGWITRGEGQRLVNPRTNRIEWTDFEPFKVWRDRELAEVMRGEKNKSYVQNQASIVHSFLEFTLKRFDLTFNPRVENALVAHMKSSGEGFPPTTARPGSLIEALLVHGETLAAEFKGPPSRVIGTATAKRSFYLALRDELGGGFPAELAKALELPTHCPRERLPFFERYLEERHQPSSHSVVRKNLRVFAQWIASSLGTTVVEGEEPVRWQFSSAGKLTAANRSSLGPVTAELFRDPLGLLAAYRSYLHTRTDLRPEYQADMFNAARRLVRWGEEVGLFEISEKAIAALKFIERDRPKVKRRAPKRAADAPSSTPAHSTDGGAARALTGEQGRKHPPLPAEISRGEVLRAQHDLIGELLREPPAELNLGDLLGAHTSDFDPRRGVVVARNASHSRLVKLHAPLIDALTLHLERLRRSPFQKEKLGAYEGPLFVDNRGESVLTCNVPPADRELDAARMKAMFNLASVVFHQVRSHSGGQKVALTEILALELDDVRASHSEVTVRDSFGDPVGAFKLDPPSAAMVRSFIELVRASELGALWSSCNPTKPLFMAPNGDPLLDVFPGPLPR